MNSRLLVGFNNESPPPSKGRKRMYPRSVAANGLQIMLYSSNQKAHNLRRLMAKMFGGIAISRSNNVYNYDRRR